MSEYSCVKLDLVAWKINFLPMIYRQVKRHRDSHIWALLQGKYEEGAGRAFIHCEGSPLLESSVGVAHAPCQNIPRGPQPCGVKHHVRIKEKITSQGMFVNQSFVFYRGQANGFNLLPRIGTRTQESSVLILSTALLSSPWLQPK